MIKNLCLINFIILTTHLTHLNRASIFGHLIKKKRKKNRLKDF